MHKTYVSTAVLRMDGAPEQLRRVEQEVLSRTSLTALIVNHDLYSARRAQLPLEEIVQQMRMHDILIRPAGHPPAFLISFAADSRVQAQQIASALVAQFSEKNRELRGAPIEILEPPSAPQRFTGAFLPAWVAAGLLLGLSLGAGATAIRRRILTRG